MNLKGIAAKAKDLVDKRGGTDALKEDAEELKRVAQGRGSLADKAKAAAEVLKTPGGDAPGAESSTQPERERARGKVAGETRGKHADRADSPGRGGGGGKGRGGRGGGAGRGRGRV